MFFRALEILLLTCRLGVIFASESLKCTQRYKGPIFDLINGPDKLVLPLASND